MDHGYGRAAPVFTTTAEPAVSQRPLPLGQQAALSLQWPKPACWGSTMRPATRRSQMEPKEDLDHLGKGKRETIVQRAKCPGRLYLRVDGGYDVRSLRPQSGVSTAPGTLQ